MLKFLKTGAALATATTVMAVSLMTGPAANAATHKISSDSKHITTSVKVVGHTDKLVFDAASKKAVAVQFKHLDTSKTYLATKYTVSLKHGKKVLYRTTTSTYRAMDADIQVQLASVKYKNDAAVKKVIKHVLSLSEAGAKKELTNSLDTFALEIYGNFVPYIVSSIKTELAETPNATWADLAIDESSLNSYSPESGLRLQITGTPQDYTISLTGKYTKAALVYTSATDSYQKTNWISLGSLGKGFNL